MGEEELFINFKISLIVFNHFCSNGSATIKVLSQLLHARMQPKCASEEIRNLFYKYSHEKSARTKAAMV